MIVVFPDHTHLHFVITRSERVDLLALLCMMFSCVLSLSLMVSRVRCGTCLYKYHHIFAFFLTFIFTRLTFIHCLQMGNNARKPVFGGLRTTQAQTSLRISAG